MSASFETSFAAVPATVTDPDRDCPRCPRLVEFRQLHRGREPEWFNAPVPSFLPCGGAKEARLLIVGLAPGLRGANKSGRPFTGDYAGDLLYETLDAYGFSRGTFKARPDDGLELVGAAITNAVRCVPPENKPTGPEVKACCPFLINTLASMTNLTAILVLGRVAHETVLTTLEKRRASYPFSHGRVHDLGHYTLFNSYHCSRYNTNTGRLTPQMFRDVFDKIAAHLG
ncbi:uracil-DNA glycosylase [Breoghania sp.]|uniref:uracil-DNA glycosylase n=1 Tax=Breoghania sp. TaxID=2065378 RepID=UPI00262F4C34|nr:uracil-DNA glycosylase [Breoghania sp.]MDJ0932274.1 uracil-DNA glycosylase [Breoghania sp.]